jgi:predicted nucleic acid-binding protein
MRGEYHRAFSVGSRLLSQEVIQLEWVLPEDVHRAWEVFRTYSDKSWSFTDCVSQVVMERLGIQTAFAFDKHFRQFGTVQVVP